MTTRWVVLASLCFACVSYAVDATWCGSFALEEERTIVTDRLGFEDAWLLLDGQGTPHVWWSTWRLAKAAPSGVGTLFHGIRTAKGFAVQRDPLPATQHVARFDSLVTDGVRFFGVAQDLDTKRTALFVGPPWRRVGDVEGSGRLWVSPSGVVHLITFTPGLLSSFRLRGDTLEPVAAVPGPSRLGFFAMSGSGRLDVVYSFVEDLQCGGLPLWRSALGLDGPSPQVVRHDEEPLLPPTVQRRQSSRLSRAAEVVLVFKDARGHLAELVLATNTFHVSGCDERMHHERRPCLGPPTALRFASQTAAVELSAELAVIGTEWTSREPAVWTQPPHGAGFWARDLSVGEGRLLIAHLHEGKEPRLETLPVSFRSQPSVTAVVDGKRGVHLLLGERDRLRYLRLRCTGG